MAEPLAGLDRRITFFRPTRDKPQEKNRFLKQINREGKSFAKTLNPHPNIELTLTLQKIWI